MGICKSLCRSTPLSHEELRNLLKTQLCVFSIINTITTVVTLATGDDSAIERGAMVASLILLWASFPFGMYGVWKENGGVTALYIIFGVLCGVIRVALSMIASAVVATSCQTEQVSFKGCFRALDDLSCLRYSNCTRDILDNYNDLSTTIVSCDAWGTDDCTNAPDTMTSFAAGEGKLILLIVDVFTACVPVYMAFLYFTRKEASKVTFEQTDAELGETTQK
eukprot:TRINITY_DN4777_c0_g1_i4.p1 TRINITY_DN4777_c0_g1~~TRINITY_DN4777_c0_g1_i4.p1  ORF type:complete len:222 (+),score=54.18 TRINITY_DN4777_c0_g1_i4:149-814(+)